MASVERLRRETSIDLVRGADVLLMLFVNQMAGVRGTPAFLLHKAHDVDGMTITDVVFPAFLFITGLAIPFALGGRLRRGDTGGVWRHILTRTIALLVMGVLMVNAERPGTGGVISPDLWNVLMSVGVVLVWLAPPRDGPGRGQPWLRIAGAVLPARGYAAGLAAAGFLLHALHGLHPAFWVNKVLATPPWCLLSSALTAACWAVIFVLTDVKGWRRWPKAVSIAGENALLCYLMAPFLLSLFALSAPLFGGNNFYEKLGESTVIGFVRSTVFAWVVVRLCGRLRDAGVRMQL